MNILLVDDSNTMRRIQRNQLESLGHTQITEAVNGEQAYELLQKEAFDLIILDWNMPVMDGMTLLKKIRSNQAYADVKVIMCTSESDKKKVVEAMKAGANNYLVKPFTPEGLAEKLMAI